MRKKQIGPQSPQQKASRIFLENEKQLQLFYKWKKFGKWSTFHHSHYDWWAFPIDQLSSYGDTWTVQHNHIKILKQNKRFIDNLRQCAYLVACSWGYNMNQGKKFKKLADGQKWTGWGIRLYKMTKSLLIFNLVQEYQQMRTFALEILKKEQISYGKRNFRKFFQTDQIQEIRKLEISQKQKKLDPVNYSKYINQNQQKILIKDQPKIGIKMKFQELKMSQQMDKYKKKIQQ